MNNNFIFNMLGISVTAGLIGAALALFGRKCRISAKWLCICWAILAVRLLIPLNLPISLWNMDLSSPATQEGVITPDDYIEITFPSMPLSSGIAGEDTSAEPEVFSAENLISAAVLIWLAGTAVFIVRQGFIYFSQRKELLRFSRTADDSTKMRAEKIAEKMRVKRRYKILVCEKAVSPMLMGALHPIIVIPNGFDGERLELALRHELTHLRRGDIWLKLLLTVANAAHWFNPLVWYIAAQTEKDIESACDEGVLVHADCAERRAYCDAILDMMSGRKMPLTTTFSNSKEDIMKRFERIFHTGPQKSGVRVAAAVLCMSLLLSGLVGCTVAEAKTTSAETQPSITHQDAPGNNVLSEQQDEISASPDVTSAGSAGSLDTDAVMELINRRRAEKGLAELKTAEPSVDILKAELEQMVLGIMEDVLSDEEKKQINAAQEIAEVSSEEENNQTKDVQGIAEAAFDDNGLLIAFICQINADPNKNFRIAGKCPATAEEVVDTLFSHSHFEYLLLGDITEGSVVTVQDNAGQAYWVFAGY